MWGINSWSRSRVAVISFPESQQCSCLVQWELRRWASCAGPQARSSLWAAGHSSRLLTMDQGIWGTQLQWSSTDTLSECFRMLKAANWSLYWSGPSVICRLISNMKYFPVLSFFSTMKLYFENVSYKLHHYMLGGVKCGPSTVDSKLSVHSIFLGRCPKFDPVCSSLHLSFV